MRKIILLLTIIASAGALYAQGNYAGCPLYNITKVQLENYYGKNDFNDAAKTSGWFRVEEFLSWLQSNEATVLKRLEKSGLNVERVCAGAILGDRQSLGYIAAAAGSFYIYDKYVPQDKQRKFPKIKAQFDTALMTPEEFYVPTAFPFVPSINLGMHEGAHYLDILSGGEGLLSEFTAAFAQLEHALPIKEGEDLPVGARNPFDTLLIRKGTFLTEHAESYITPLLIKNMRKKGITSPDKRSLELKRGYIFSNYIAAVIAIDEGIVSKKDTTYPINKVEDLKKYLPPFIPAESYFNELIITADKMYKLHSMPGSANPQQIYLTISEKLTMEEFSARFTDDADTQQKITAFSKNLAYALRDVLPYEEIKPYISLNCDEDGNCMTIFTETDRQVLVTGQQELYEKLKEMELKIIPYIYVFLECEYDANNVKLNPVPKGYL